MTGIIDPGYSWTTGIIDAGYSFVSEWAETCFQNARWA